MRSARIGYKMRIHAIVRCSGFDGVEYMPQYSDELLDTFIAPELSKLTSVGASVLDEHPDYLSAAFRAHIFGLRLKSSAILHLSLTFLKRSMTATAEYRAGRECLARYIEGLTLPAHDLRSYLAAVSHFEQCIGAAYQSVELFGKLNVYLVPGHPQTFKSGDGSIIDRLNRLNNILKHFTPSQAETASAPIWITNTSLKSENCCLTFDELVEVMKDLWGINRVTFEEIPREALVSARR